MGAVEAANFMSNERKAWEFVPGVTDPFADFGCPDSDHVKALRRLAAEPMSPPDGEGDGIVWVGGGKYWPGIVAGLKTLREIGCTLPVELWHDSVREPIDTQLIEDCHPWIVRDIRDVNPQRIEGWENKLTAIAFSRFERLIFLDADAYLVNDPAPLFAQLGESAPFLFWDDLPKMATKIRWGNVWPSGNTGVPPVQGGQLLIDRRRAWRLVVMSHWQNQHSDYYYRRRPMLYYGDQHAWNVSAAVLDSLGEKGSWGSLGPAPYRRGAFECSLDGKVHVIHRCGGKLFPVEHIPVGKDRFANPQWNRIHEATIFKHYAAALAYKQDSEAEFTEVYRSKIWGDGSGSGSRGIEAKETVRRIGPRVRGKSVVDLGCGDGVVAKDLPCQSYVGYECAGNAPWYAGRRGRVHLDFFRHRDELPTADVCLMKDVLHHWPTWMIEEFLPWLTSCGKFKEVYLIQDVHQHEDGADTYLGGYRALHPNCEPLKNLSVEFVEQFMHKAILRLKVTNAVDS